MRYFVCSAGTFKFLKRHLFKTLQRTIYGARCLRALAHAPGCHECQWWRRCGWRSSPSHPVVGEARVRGARLCAGGGSHLPRFVADQELRGRPRAGAAPVCAVQRDCEFIAGGGEARARARRGGRRARRGRRLRAFLLCRCAPWACSATPFSAGCPTTSTWTARRRRCAGGGGRCCSPARPSSRCRCFSSTPRRRCRRARCRRGFASRPSSTTPCR